MAAGLSRRDLLVLDKLKDPEANPETAPLLDEALPKDPNVTEDTVYQQASQREKEVVTAIQEAEALHADGKIEDEDLVEAYRKGIEEFGALITEQPRYASARNNRAQALRRLHGDDILLSHSPTASRGLLQDADATKKHEAAATVLSDLDRAISLLSPRSLWGALSPTAARTLSLAHTQRAAIYHTTSKLLGTSPLCLGNDGKEATWRSLEFEEAASHDFAMGGRYGNEIAKSLAVSTNPTAKLCGQMVREMMKKELEPGLL